MLLQPSDRSQTAADFVKTYLLTHSAAGNNIGGNPITSASGLKAVYAGAATAFAQVSPASDPPAPRHNRHRPARACVYHRRQGQDRRARPADDPRAGRRRIRGLRSLRNGRIIGAPVETTQIAPTIMRLLGLNLRELQAVQIEGTKVLPSLGGNGH